MKLANIRKFIIFISMTLAITILAVSLIDGQKPLPQQLVSDIQIRQTDRPLTLKEEAFLSFNSKTVTRVFELAAIAETPARKKPVQLLGMNGDANITYSEKLPRQKISELMKTHPEQKPFEAVVNKSLLDALGIPLGGSFRIGHALFIAVAIISQSADGMIKLDKPVVYVPPFAFRATHLMGPASNVQYIYRLDLAKGITAAQLKAAIKKEFPDATWEILP